MTREEILDRIKKEFGNKITNFFEKSLKRIYIDVVKENIPGIIKFIFKDLSARFNIASGVDTPEGIEILYHFEFDRLNFIISIRTLISKNDCAIESVTSIMKGAEWIEREIHELLGVEFKNHPNMKPLLLPDGWPKDKFPLRRDFKQEDVEAELDK